MTLGREFDGTSVWVAPRVIIFDDRHHGGEVESLLKENGFDAELTESAEDALATLGPRPVGVALINLELPNSHSLLKALRQLSPVTRCVAVARQASVRGAVTALKRGAVEYLVRPLRPRRLLTMVAALAARADEDALRIPLGTSMEHIEREVILRTIEAHGGNKAAAARVLGISRRSIYNKLAHYGLATRTA
jgi:DNA-binding NtrC family response regulator